MVMYSRFLNRVLRAALSSSANGTSGLLRRSVILSACVVWAFVSSTAQAQLVSITVDATECAPRVLFGANFPDPPDADILGGTSLTFDIEPGTYTVQVSPGGFPGPVTVDSLGNVTYAAALDGSHYTGLGTSVLKIVGYPITLSTIGLSNKATVSGLSNPGLQETVLYDLPIGTYRIQALPGGVLDLASVGVNVSFSVESSGTVSYAAGLDLDVLDGLGTATVRLLGSSVTVAGPNLNGSMFLTSLSNPYPDKSITYTLSLGNYRLQGVPGYLMDLVESGTGLSVDSAGIVSYDSDLDGVVLSGLGTNTVEVLPLTVHLDASDSTKQLFILPLGPVLPGAQGTFQLPVGTFVIHAASIPIGTFTLNSTGECDTTEFPFADGVARIRCPRPPDDFKCYKVKDLKNPPFEKATVSLTDQFGVNDGDFDVKKPFLLCNPAGVSGGLIFDPATHPVCYKIGGPKLEPADRPKVEASSELGVMQLELIKPALLCIPSTKVILP